MNRISIHLLSAVLLSGFALAATHAARADEPPPDLKKGVKILLTMRSYPVNANVYDPEVQVEDARGNWVQLKFTPTENGKEDGAKPHTVWVNFTRVEWYEVVPAKPAK